MLNSVKHGRYDAAQFLSFRQIAKIPEKILLTPLPEGLGGGG